MAQEPPSLRRVPSGPNRQPAPNNFADNDLGLEEGCDSKYNKYVYDNNKTNTSCMIRWRLIESILFHGHPWRVAGKG